MRTRSIWEETKTFFPLFLKKIEELLMPPGPICIVGASDGKFVIPLAERGWRVHAVEVDETALYGGMLKFPDGEIHEIPGLLRRLEAEGLTNVEVTLSDLLAYRQTNSCVGVFTSCSWHYSLNHKRPLAEFISGMQSLLAPGGLFCAEYMMPCEPKHTDIEHYVGERKLLKFFKAWDVLEEFYTPVFSEKAHPGTLMDHIHRMGFLMARKDQEIMNRDQEHSNHPPGKPVFTRAGLTKLEKEITEWEERLRKIRIQKGDAVAMDTGNTWHDNAGFELAEREERGVVNRLSELKNLLNGATVVDEISGQSEVIAIGVRAEIEVGGQTRTWTIVGHGESNLAEALLTYDSPLGKSIMGARPGDERKFRVGQKTHTVRVIRIL